MDGGGKDCGWGKTSCVCPKAGRRCVESPPQASSSGAKAERGVKTRGIRLSIGLPVAERRLLHDIFSSVARQYLTCHVLALSERTASGFEL